MDRAEEFDLLRVKQEISPLLLTLQTVGISTIAEVRSLLDEIEAQKPTAQQWLREFVRIDSKETGEPSAAVAADVLMVLVSFFHAEKLPGDFNWNGIWVPPTEAALKETMANIASSD